MEHPEFDVTALIKRHSGTPADNDNMRRVLLYCDLLMGTFPRSFSNTSVIVIAAANTVPEWARAAISDMAHLQGFSNIRFPGESVPSV